MTAQVSYPRADTVVLPESEWTFDDERRLTDHTPGTWCRRADWMDRRIGANFSCPSCHRILHLIAPTHQVDHEGCVTPEWRCAVRTPDGREYGCDLVANLVLDRWLKKPLWCVIIGRVRTGAPETMYINAMTRQEALFHAHIKAPDVLIECGLAIGNFAADGTGKSGVAVTDLTSVKMPPKAIRSFGGIGGGK